MYFLFVCSTICFYHQSIIHLFTSLVSFLPSSVFSFHSVSDPSHFDVDPDPGIHIKVDPDPLIHIWEKLIRILGSTFP